MAVDLINNHILLPHRADWATPPTFQRAWQTDVAESILGNEARAGLRACPRISLTWMLSKRTQPEQQELDDRIRAALKNGKACAPYHGRGSLLTADCNNVTVNLADTSFGWKVNDWVFFQDDLLNYNFRQVNVVAGAVLTLGAAVSQTFPAGSMVWPILFGKLTAKDMEAVTDWHSSTSLTLQELISRDTVPIGGAVNTSGAGIGWMRIGTTNIVG